MNKEQIMSYLEGLGFEHSNEDDVNYEMFKFKYPDSARLIIVSKNLGMVDDCFAMFYDKGSIRPDTYVYADNLDQLINKLGM